MPVAIGLRLLVHDTDLSLNRPTIRLDGRSWHLTELLDISSPDTLPMFICVSYVWGHGKAPSPFEANRSISDQTMAALEAAMAATRDSEAQAFWIDAICVPADGALQRATLESMGFIYSCATEVVVVLSESSFAVVEQMSHTDRLDDQQLQVLEQDRWVASVWTYQEVVNGGRIRFVSINEATTRPNVEGDDFFNNLGYSLSMYKKERRIDSFQMEAHFPHLSVMEDTIADWREANLQERSALQIMANLDRRVCREPQNYFYAMMGVITRQPSWDTANSTLEELSERVMMYYEEKNDYSFIYSSTKRDTCPGKRWRPAPGPMRSIIAWYCHGMAAKGFYDPSGFWLCDMLTCNKAESLSDAGREIILENFAKSNQSHHTDDEIANLTYNALTLIGFTGSGEFVTLENGLLFPQRSLKDENHPSVVVSTNVSWVTFGAPSLALCESKEGHMTYVPGVYVGVVDRELARNILIDPLAKVQPSVSVT